ncbi:MAG: hypothetical protein PHZ28_00175 [Candidatus Izemoplasmatales bacterium]|nr:hypothetical protein [Candidatus Izemoplasmatales bacterium]
MTKDDMIVDWIKRHDKLIVFVLFMGFVVYAFLTVIFNLDAFYETFIASVFFLLLVIGSIAVAIKSRLAPKEKIRFLNWESLFVFAGVILTYEISYLFSWSSVLSSASIGFFGYLFFRKYSMGIYCGSFAGMMSYAILNHYQMLIVGIVCVFSFQIIKTILDGYGGRLGSIAFISTTIVSLIFAKSMLEIEVEVIWYLVFVFAVAGSMISSFIHNQLGKSAVLASALPSLIITILIDFLFPNLAVYSGIFFTASFVGMSNKYVITNWIISLIIGIILAIIFLLFLDYFNGFGGKMGLMAFTSIMISQGLFYLAKKVKLFIFR